MKIRATSPGSILLLPASETTSKRSRGDPSVAPFLLVLVLIAAIPTSSLAQTPFTATVVNHTAAESITCNVCTPIHDTPCGPGSTCTIQGLGYNGMWTLSSNQVRWRTLLRDGATTQWHTGNDYVSHLSEILRVDVYDVVPGEFVWLFRTLFTLPENGGAVTGRGQRHPVEPGGPPGLQVSLEPDLVPVLAGPVSGRRTVHGAAPSPSLSRDRTVGSDVVSRRHHMW